MFGCGDMCQESRLDSLARWELLSNWDEELEGFSIDITDFDTTFVGEEDVVALSNGVDANIELGIGRMRKERFNDKGVECSRGAFNLNAGLIMWSTLEFFVMYLLSFTSAFCNPLLCFWPSLVKSEKSGLASTFNKLIWFSNEFCVVDPTGEMSVRSDGVCCRVPGDLSDLSWGIYKVLGYGYCL